MHTKARSSLEHNLKMSVHRLSLLLASLARIRAMCKQPGLESNKPCSLHNLIHINVVRLKNSTEYGATKGAVGRETEKLSTMCTIIRSLGKA